MTAKVILERLIPHEATKVKRFLVIFYIIGIAGFLWPYSRDLFINLTGLALLLSTFLLFWFHRSGFNKKSVIVFITIYLAGFFIEVIGVDTGAIFGHYTYGSGLGPTIFGTPLMIGVNWLMLTYCFASILRSMKLTGVAIIILGSAGMLVYDLVMEQVAPMLDLWYWNNNIIPIKNYIAWFAIAVIFQSVIVFTKTKLINPIALTLLLCQFGFFVVLALYKLAVL